MSCVLLRTAVYNLRLLRRVQWLTWLQRGLAASLVQQHARKEVAVGLAPLILKHRV